MCADSELKCHQVAAESAREMSDITRTHRQLWSLGLFFLWIVVSLPGQVDAQELSLIHI